MAAEWEIVYTRALPSQVEDLDLYRSKLSEPQRALNLEDVLWDREHHDCTLTSGTACSCSSDSSEQDDDPSFLFWKQRCQSLICDPNLIQPLPAAIQPISN